MYALGLFLMLLVGITIGGLLAYGIVKGAARNVFRHIFDRQK